MIKLKLAKALMLGLCMTALSTSGTVFALTATAPTALGSSAPAESVSVAPDTSDENALGSGAPLTSEGASDAVTSERQPLISTNDTAANPESSNQEALTAEAPLIAEKSDTEESSNKGSAPITAFALAGGAALVGGAIIVTKKKKTK